MKNSNGSKWRINGDIQWHANNRSAIKRDSGISAATSAKRNEKINQASEADNGVWRK